MKWVKLVKAEENNQFSKIIEELTNNKVEWDIEKQINKEELVLRLYNYEKGEGDNIVKINIDYDLDGYQPAFKGSHSPFAASPEDYYGQDAYYENFYLLSIEIETIDSVPVKHEIDVKSPFGERLHSELEHQYTTDVETDEGW